MRRRERDQLTIPHLRLRVSNRVLLDANARARGEALRKEVVTYSRSHRRKGSNQWNCIHKTKAFVRAPPSVEKQSCAPRRVFAPFDMKRAMIPTLKHKLRILFTSAKKFTIFGGLEEMHDRAADKAQVGCISALRAVVYSCR
jgi:hypothetical protein